MGCYIGGGLPARIWLWIFYTHFSHSKDSLKAMAVDEEVL